MRALGLCVVSLLIGVWFGFASVAHAATFPEKPHKSSFIVDKAKLITAEDAKQINTLAFALLKDERIPVYVVTIPSLVSYQASEMTIEQYTQALFDRWGIGSEKRNYGMLLLVSKGDRKARIEFGKAFNHRYDNEATEIMQSLIVPQFKKDNYSVGILDGVTGLNAVARGLGLPKPKLSPWFIPALIVIVIAIIAIAYSLFKSGKSGWAWVFLAFVGVMLFALLRSSGKGGSSGGFGGGKSGGGGASGSW